MPLFSRGRTGSATPLLLAEEEYARDGTPASASFDKGSILARLLREALAALERPHLSNDDIAAPLLRLRHRAADPRDVEL